MLASAHCRAVLVAVLAVWTTMPSPGADPPASEILRRALDLNSGITDYTARTHAEFRAPDGADIPESQRTMTVDFRVLFKRPDKVKIEANQPVVLPKQLFAFGNLGALIAKECSVSLVAKRVIDGVPVYNVRVMPPDSGEGRTMLFWIDGANWTVRRMRVSVPGPQGQQPDLEIAWVYAKVQGFYVPTRISASLPGVIFGPNVRGQGQASLSLTDWRINVGLRDSVFAK